MMCLIQFSRIFIQKRILATRDDVDLVAINHCGEIEYMCYKLKYDSTHGRFEGEVKESIKMIFIIIFS